MGYIDRICQECVDRLCCSVVLLACVIGWMDVPECGVYGGVSECGCVWCGVMWLNGVAGWLVVYLPSIHGKGCDGRGEDLGDIAARTEQDRCRCRCRVGYL